MPSHADLYALADGIGVSPDPSEAALHETRLFLDAPGIGDSTLVDRTDLPLVTIDEPDSHDLDQAVHVERRLGEDVGDDSGDGFVVHYAIADAAYFVRPGSALFDEALDRGATYYMPGLVLPMLPRELSEGIVSLGPGVDRRALLFRVDLDESGVVRETTITRARVRSRLKTSHQVVARYYKGEPLADFDDPARAPGLDDASRDAVLRSLDALAEVGERRLALAEVRDTVRLYRTEIRVELDGSKDGDDGNDDESLGFVAFADPRDDAERYNEQISLLCNVEGARLLARGGSNVQGVFRYHRPPGGHDLARFERQVDALVRRHELDPAVWRWRRGGSRSLADYLNALPRGGEHDRLARAIHRQALLAAGRSGFDIAPGLHHGVGAEAYARFTAPMREVVGVFVHKETWELLGEEEAAPDAEDEALRERVVKAAERARSRQRRLDSEVNRRVIDTLFAADPRGNVDGRPATVMGITRDKVHVQLDDPPIDVKVYRRHLEEQLGERLRPGPEGATLLCNGRSEFVVGDAVLVRAAGQDEARDRWRLELHPLEEQGRGGAS